VQAQKGAAAQREVYSLTETRKTARLHEGDLFHVDLEDFMDITVCMKKGKKLHPWSTG